MSPAHFRELFYPGLCRVMKGYKDLGLRVIKHTDGMIWPLIDMIVDSGHRLPGPHRPGARAWISAEVKQKFGQPDRAERKRGLLPPHDPGTPEQVAAATRDALRIGAPGGGFILSSSNSIHSSVKPENYMALLRTLKELGRYPIRA